jgi:micrococcal nuclease
MIKTIALNAAAASLLMVSVQLMAGGIPQYKLISVEDGDTLVVEIEGSQERVQLIGIDAPEDVDNAKLQRDLQNTGLAKETLLQLGQTATAHLKSLLSDVKTVGLEADLSKRDRYGRIPVIAHTPEGSSINELLVADGYAVVLGRYPLDPELKQRLIEAENGAVNQPRGLWSTHPAETRSWSGRIP